MTAPHLSPLASSPSLPIYRVYGAAANQDKILDPGAPVYAIFVRRLAAGIASIDLYFGLNDRPHALRQGNWLRVPRGIATGLYLSTAAAGQVDLELVTSVPDAVEYHES